jgi:DNA-damage-inducible protein J
MAKTAYINQRIDADLKSKAEKVFSRLSLAPAAAIALFYQQVILRKGLPFDVCVPNAETVAALKEAEAGKGEVYEASTKEAFDEILGK